MPLFRRKTNEKPAKSPTFGSGQIRTNSDRSSLSSPISPSTPDSWGDESDIGVSAHGYNGVIPSEKRPRTLTLSESVLNDGPVIPEDSLESPLRTSSRLSKTLLEIVRDKDALSCFKSFLKSQMAEHLIQFWCEAESFHASTLMRLHTQSLQSMSKSALHRRRNDSLKGCHDAVQGTPAVPLNALRAAETTATHDLSSSDCVVDTYNPGLVIPATTVMVDTCSTNNQNADINQPIHVSTSSCHQPTDPLHHDFHPQPSAASVCCPDSILKSLSDREDNNTSTAKLGKMGEISKAAMTSPLTPDNKCCDIGEDTQVYSDYSQEDLVGKLKKSIERDAVTIFSTYIAKDAPRPINVDDDLRAEAISKICKENGEVDPECFVGCQRFVLSKLEADYYQSFKDSEFHCRHQVNLLTSEKVYLPDILLNENALCYFMEFMEQEGGSDLMQMWLAADNFQQQLMSTSGSYDREQAELDAMVIYDRYFSLQATNPLGFDDKLRFEIESNICREEGPLPACFTKAKSIVLKIIDKLYFSNYLHSQIYYRYLSDLITTVQMSEDMPSRSCQKTHKRTESDASSEHSAGSYSTGAESIISRNTLLAVDTRKMRKTGTIEGDFSMNMDMLNPDNLWKRPAAKTESSSSNLILGSVNELGQFVSHFEPNAEADKKKGSILFKRKKEKDKEEEEMALRIAQMIISDVNTMTKTGESMLKKPMG